MRVEEIRVLEGADQYLYNLKLRIIKFNEYISQGKELESLKLTTEILEGLEYLIKGIKLTRKSQKKKIKIDKLEKFLDKLLDGLKNNNFTILNKLFNLEIIPILDKIHEDIKSIL